MFQKLTHTSWLQLCVGFVLAVVMATSILFTSPLAASAQTVESMTREQLIALIMQLLAQLEGGGGDSGGVVDYSVVCPFAWTRDLTIGDTGQDVYKLQQFLNADPDTRIANFGFGSPGNETTYYGNATANAVSDFQTKYRTDILSPLGLVNPTGFFSSATRYKANELCSTANPTNGGTTELAGITLGSFPEEDTVEPGRQYQPVIDIEIRPEQRVTLNSLMVVFENTYGDSQLAPFPWHTFESISLWHDGNKIAERSADGQADWPFYGNERGSGFVMPFYDIDLDVAGGSFDELTVAVSLANDAPENLWDLYLTNVEFMSNGIAIQMHNDYHIPVSVVDPAPYMVVKSSQLDPDASTLQIDMTDNSDPYTVFAFDIENEGEQDISIEEIILDFDLFNHKDGVTAADIIDDIAIMADGVKIYADSFTNYGQLARFDIDGDIWIDAGDTVTVEVEASFEPADSGVTNGVGFNVSVESVSGGAEFGDDIDAQGGAQSETHTLSSAGLSVVVVDTDADSVGETGIFTIQFDVTAFGEDVVIDADPSSGASTEVDYVIGSRDLLSWGLEESTHALTSTADEHSLGEFTVQEGETETFELTVTVDPEEAGFYRVGLSIVGGMELSGNDRYTDYLFIDGISGPNPDPDPDYLDEVRALDMRLIGNALLEYYQDHGTFKITGGGYKGNGNGWFNHTGTDTYPKSVAEVLLEGGYLEDIVVDPTGAITADRDKDQSGYMIITSARGGDYSGGQAFTLWANLDNPTDADRATLDQCIHDNYDNYSMNWSDRYEHMRMNYCLSSPAPSTQPDLGTYEGYMNGSLFIRTENISEADALANCELNANNNPTNSVRCTWEGRVIYETTPSSSAVWEPETTTSGSGTGTSDPSTVCGPNYTWDSREGCVWTGTSDGAFYTDGMPTVAGASVDSSEELVARIVLRLSELISN